MAQESLTKALLETFDVFEKAGKPWTTPEVADHLDLERRTTYARLERLAEQGRLETKSVGANARVWWRPSTSDTKGDRDTQGESAHADWKEQEFRMLVDATEEYAIFLLDADGHVQTWNPGAQRIKGYDADDIIGKHFSVFYTPDDCRDGVPEKNLRAAAETGSARDEGWRRRADGTQFWANVTITALRDDDGDIVGFAKVTRDMTDRREYEQRLREEKSFVESILDTQPDILYAFDTNGELLRWNDSFREVTGYSDAELETMKPQDFIADRGVEETTEAIQKIFDEGDDVSVELPLVTADGEEIPYEFTGGPITDDDGIITGFTGVGRDISDRKAREKRLERQRDELESELDEVFQRISDGFYALDEEYRFNYVNDQARELLGLEGTVIGQHVEETVDVSEDLEAALRQAFEEQEQVVFEDYIEPVDTCLETTVYPSESGLSVYLVDITERKEREKELHRYEVIAETASDGIVSIDDESRIQSVNPAVETLFGYDAEDLLGESLTKLIPERLVEDHEAAIAEYLQTGEQSFEWDHVELPGLTADGAEIPLSLSFSEYEHDGQHYFTGIIRDISERKNRERVLREMHDIISDRTQSFEEQVQALLRLGRSEFGTKYSTLSQIQGDDYVFEFVDSEDDTIQAGDRTLVSATNCEIAASKEQTVVLGDIERDAPEETDRAGFTDWGISCYLGAPVYVDDDVYGTVCFYDTDTRNGQFSEWEETIIDLMSRWLSYELQRRKTNEQLHRQNEQLAALNSLNEVVQEITNGVIEQSTREGIERTVCEYLAESNSYEFAWIGEVDTRTQTVTARSEAGVEGYLDDNPITVDPDDERGDGPTGRAFRTGEIQTLQDVREDPAYDPWCETAEEYGFRSSAAIPLTHEDIVYGVLNVYAERPAAFEGQEESVLAHLGETIGHAIAAAERKQALMSDEVVELEFRIRDVFAAADTPVEFDGTVTLDHTVAVGEDEYLVYGTATSDAIDSIVGLVENHPDCEVVAVHSDEDRTSFEFRVADPPILSAIASRGGYIEHAVIEDNDLSMTIHLAPSADVRQCIDIVEESYPDAEMVRRQQISRRDDDPKRFQQRVIENLTDRQRDVLEVAYHAGFYNWPRDSTGGEIAESLDVAEPTFHQHLRKAEGKVFDLVFSSPDAA